MLRQLCICTVIFAAAPAALLAQEQVTIPEEAGAYAPGLFSGPCELYDSHEGKQPKDGDTREVRLITSFIYFAGRRGAPNRIGKIAGPDCEPLELGPGEYELVTMANVTQYRYFCSPAQKARCVLTNRELPGDPMSEKVVAFSVRN